MLVSGSLWGSHLHEIEGPWSPLGSLQQMPSLHLALEVSACPIGPELSLTVLFVSLASMCYQISNTLRMVRQVQRTQIRIIPVAIRLLIFLAYIFFALVCVFVSRFIPSCRLSHTVFRHVVRTSVLSIWDRHTYARDIYTSTCASKWNISLFEKAVWVL